MGGSGTPQSPGYSRRSRVQVLLRPYCLFLFFLLYFCFPLPFLCPSLLKWSVLSARVHLRCAVVFAEPGRVEATESLTLLWTRWEASIVAGTLGCRFTPQWPREKSCLSVQSTELDWKEVSSSPLICKAGNACMTSVSDSWLQSSGTLVVSTVRLSLGPGCERLRLANPTALSCTCTQPHPAAPQILRPKCAVVFTDCRCSWQLSREPVQPLSRESS